MTKQICVLPMMIRFQLIVSYEDRIYRHKQLINPLPLLFKALLHGQKDCIFFSGNLIYTLQQERFKTFRLAQDIYIPSTLER
jgi:hypothetical protein